MLELWGTQRTPSLPSLPGPLWPEVILTDLCYLRYIDDILFIYPRNNDLAKITSKLNKIEPSIDLTNKLETNNTSPF